MICTTMHIPCMLYPVVHDFVGRLIWLPAIMEYCIIYIYTLIASLGPNDYPSTYVCISLSSTITAWFALFLELRTTCAPMRTKERSEPRGRRLQTLRAVEKCAGTRLRVPPSLRAVANTLFCSTLPILSYIAKDLFDERHKSPLCLFCHVGQARKEKMPVGRER